jgi:AcrR family transcriptional regulator
MIEQGPTPAEPVPKGCAETTTGRRDARLRILEATFEALVEHGYAGTSTREIARRAKVSKRELYAIFGSKQGIIAAMIEGRAARMRLPLALPNVTDQRALEETLVRFGANLVREVSHPAVTALFRLAVTEAERSPEVARALDEGGRRKTRGALVTFLERAAAQGLVGDADPETLAAEFLALLWGDLQMSLLMRLAEAPPPAGIEQRARAAASAVLTLYPARSG